MQSLKLTHRHTAFEYHELSVDEVILAAGLVRARPGVFIAGIEHVLVLSTGPTAVDGRRVLLLGVEVTAQGLKLYETGMSAPTNGVVMRELRGTDTGRVFCVGSDNCVHELVYQAHDSWFYSRCYLQNVTQPRLANLVPTFFKADKRIVHTALDNARRLLYVLRDGDQIDVYSVPLRGALAHTGSMYGVVRQAGLLHSHAEVGPMVWLAPTEPDTRSSVCLVAVTSRGFRIYFDDFQRRAWAQLVVRAPPGGAGGMAPLCSSAYYAKGVCLLAFPAQQTLYGIGASTPATGAMLTYAGASTPAGAWQEASTRVALGAGAAPVMAEAAPAVPSDATGATLRPCALQTTTPPRVFLVLDASGLTELVERRPADVLAGLLGGGGANAPPVVDFFTRYGPVEGALCALAIAAGNTHVDARDAVAQAIRVFFGPLGAWPAEQRVLRGLLAKPARLEAHAEYGGSPVHGVWCERLAPPAWLGGTDALPLVRDGRLAAAIAQLTPLLAFMQRHTQLFERADDSRSPADGAEAAQLQALVQRTLEAAHFVHFLADHDLRAIARAAPAETRTKLGALRFADLVASADGRAVANDLVTALIESQSGARASVDAIADALQARCGAFCSADDVRQYKASECLRNASALDARLRAERAGERDERRAALDEDLAQSLRLLLAGAAQLPLDKLEHVCATYRALGFTRGVVSLALACARAADPSDAAVAFRAAGCPADERSPRAVAYAARRRAYTLVVDALDDAAEHANALEAAAASDDALFHEELYTWLVARGDTARLLDLATPFLVDFLAGTPVLLNGEAPDAYERRLRDLLWQLHVRRGACLAAAEVLDALAHTDAYALRLSERIEYLALAVGNAKSVRPDAAHVADLVAFGTQLEEDLEVAQVQAKVLAALRPLDTLDWDGAERARFAETAAQLDSTLLDLTTLYRDVAEPFGLLEEQLLIIHTAQYQDAELVAALWYAMIAREHSGSAPDYAFQAVAALVTDVFTRLGASETACPVDIVLPLLEQYAFDTACAVAGAPSSAPGALDWHAFSALPASPVPVGWAPLVLLGARAPPDAVFDVLSALVTTAPAPWNTDAGVGFLLPDLAEYAAQWLDRALASGAAFPAHHVEAALSEYVLKLSTRTFLRADDDLERRLAQMHATLQRIKRTY